MSDYGLKNNNDFTGPVADLIKITNECSRAGLDIKQVINIIRRPDKKEVLREIKEYSQNFAEKTKTQRRLEEEQARNERASVFGIGE